MTAVGGSIRDITIEGREFHVAGDSGSGRKIGGAEAELAPNGDGNTARKLLTIMPWRHDSVVLEVDDDRGDQEFLQARADESGYKPMTFTYASGHIYGGSGTVVGEVSYDTENATATVSLSGPGKLEKQS